MGRHFQRTIENFTCENCGAAVTGDGYTNHCPKCLWSRHVDAMPGDRAADCGAMMAPVAVEAAGSGYTIIHQCAGCGEVRRNRSGPDDDVAALIEIARQAAENDAKQSR
ncbi:MAG: RNHCP domain-containing protein [Alphaproteobacteria bacterium]